MKGVVPGTIGICCLAIAVALLCAAGEAAARPQDEVADPVLRDVLRLLEEKVPDEAILTWLERSGAVPAEIGPDELVTLNRAGASATLLTRMVRLAQAVERPSEATPAPEPAALRAPALGDAKLAVAVDYSGRSPEGEDDDLFVYLDGRRILRVPSRATAFSPPVRADLPVERGPHVVRILRERHMKRSGLPGGIRHEAWACDEAIRFDVGEGGEYALAVDVDGWGFRSGGAEGPMRWTVSRGGAAIAGRAAAGRPLADWPELCEEIESGIESGAEPSRRARRALERCVRWSSLWPEGAPVPDRAQARAE